MAEIVSYVVGILFFLRMVGKMSIVLLFFPHAIRGIIGFLLRYNVPRSHDIIKSIELGDDTHSFDSVKQGIQLSV